jgi:hypothetical protein
MARFLPIVYPKIDVSSSAPSSALGGCIPPIVPRQFKEVTG